jgi:2-polyprenyl-3-methyl-5-hydroxy-6-metoxy-1,4-benzoquinol methylase
MGASPDLSQAIADFERAGQSDIAYLRMHYGRLVRTKALLEETWTDKGRVLDLGAHWLHQSYLYARDGYSVTAADLPGTLSTDGVRRLAASMEIRLFPYDELETGLAFRDIPDDSFDLVLLTEVIEHLAFNPVAMWRQVHRMLAAGGRIVVTTPNYHALRASLRRGARLVRSGGGLSVQDILRTPTHGHHWKEYSMAEMRDYFSLLSRDFAIRRQRYVEDYYRSPSFIARLARAVEGPVPALRPNLHMEIDLPSKTHGITMQPSWE